MIPGSLATTLLAALARPAQVEQAMLELLIERILKTARTAWPTFHVETDVFLEYIAHRIAGESLIDELSGLRTADLYLACACTAADPAALQAFEDRFMRDIDAAMRHARLPHLADEVKQQLRIKLFTSGGGLTPRIAEYSGRGDLRSWLRVTAVRAALNNLRRDRRALAGEDERLLLQVPVPGHDPELDLLKAQYRVEFRDAVREALAGLAPRERNLLRQYYLDGATFRELAKIYNVHLATIARWVEHARSGLFASTKRILTQRLGIADNDVDSIIRLIQSQLEISAIELMRDE